MWKKELPELLKKYKNKKVLITGHTGFKGTWLTQILLKYGASVCGYSLAPSQETKLFNVYHKSVAMNITNEFADIRDLDRLKHVFEYFKPEFVFHLAAQPIVRESYQDPVNTYSINVMGTVNLLECVRESNSVRSILNVTTDKVYKNNEWCWGYRENDSLDGYDPYSNSKACSELVTGSYRRSFLSDDTVRVSTARAGNVIGGGDFAHDRIIPDCIRTIQRAFVEQKDKAMVSVRNPYSIRPYQHVLEPLMAYLAIAMMQYENGSYQGCYNVGPDDYDCITTRELLNLFCEKWNIQLTDRDILPQVFWESSEEKEAPHEANFLKLDCSQIKSKFGWKPIWHIEKTIAKTVKFYKTWILNENVREEMDKEINEFIGD